MTQKIALITGASKGLGYTLAKFLDGYHVIVTARGEKNLLAAVRELSHVTAIQGDVSDPAHRQQLVDVVQKLGRLDLLINNASTLGPVPMPTLMNYPLEALAEVFKVNVIAPVALIQVMLPFLQAANGLVVNLSSDAAIGGYAGWGGYGASKAALDLISLTLANELENISVVSVDPGDMRTDMHQDAFFGEDISDRPLPEVTLPFWAWLLGQNHADINGKRYKAQAEVWEVAG